MLDRALVAGWFEAHAAPLVLYARQWLDRAAAQDVVQEAFVKLMLQSRPPTCAKAWLYRAVRNEAISRWRSERRRRLRDERSGSASWFEPHPDQVIDSQAAARALAQLDGPQREVIVLRIWAAMTLKEISQLTASPVSTVFHHYQQGLKALRKQLGVRCQTNPQ